MPGWKINCLKSEDGTNPSTSLPNTIEETTKTDSIPIPIESPYTGNIYSFWVNCFCIIPFYITNKKNNKSIYILFEENILK